MTEDGNGEFRGGVKARLERVEIDIREIKDDVKAIRADVTGWKANLGLLGVALPILVSVAVKVLWP